MSPTRRLAALLLTGLVALTACGDDDGPAPAADDATTTTAAAATSAPDTGDVTAEVTETYTTFFGDFNGDLGLLEDGDTFDPADIEALRAVSGGGTVSVTVHSVEPLTDEECTTALASAPCARVTYDLILNGNPVLPGATGLAVQQDGTWKVEKGTFCALAGLSGSTPAACA